MINFVHCLEWMIIISSIFVIFQDTQPFLDLKSLGPYNMCLADGRMRSRSYSLNEIGRWVTEVRYFEKNDVENICREDEEW